MILGETESILSRHLQDEDYDDFFGNKKKRKARRAKRKAKRAVRCSAPKRVERRAKRNQFFKDIGKVYKDIGGATAIGRAIDSLTQSNLNIDTTSSSENPSDFSIGFGADPEEPEKEKNGIPTVVYILGGVVVVGVIGLAVMSNSKNKQYQQYPQ
ncbi:MAG: hypothetical protein ABF274_08320 [Nonlabens sp.]|uniref:hypothetical protein n=1 Tax=Nonlabens sp. TaxID=1888209 RepID=UPI003219107D